jgi:hypothetical protein
MYFLQLPQELIISCLAFSDIKSIANLCLTSKFCNKLGNDGYLWFLLLKRNYPDFLSASRLRGLKWKSRLNYRAYYKKISEYRKFVEDSSKMNKNSHLFIRKYSDLLGEEIPTFDLWTYTDIHNSCVNNYVYPSSCIILCDTATKDTLLVTERANGEEKYSYVTREEGDKLVEGWRDEGLFEFAKGSHWYTYSSENSNSSYVVSNLRRFSKLGMIKVVQHYEISSESLRPSAKDKKIVKSSRGSWEIRLYPHRKGF